ncbi:MAG: M1 family aminopeptidase [Tepidiformaceae bacterium]
MPDRFLFEEYISSSASFAEPPSPAHALPGDRQVWPRDRVVDVRHTRLELKLDLPARGISGTATHTVAPLNDGLGHVEFDACEMTIESVKVAGSAASYDYDGARIRIDIGGARKRGVEFRIAIAYRATPRLGLYFTGPDEGYPDKPVQVWSQGQDEDSRYWFPCFDYTGEKQSSEVIVAVPGHWYALSNGRLLQDKKNRDGTRTFHWFQERPHSNYLITLAAGELDRIDASTPKLTIDYFVEPAARSSGELTFKNTPRMIELFERLTGVAYPWAKYSQVVVRDFIFGGMENTSATTMTENILLDRKGARDYSSDDLISHELAHMWWGDLLTCRDWSHGWLNEGFATYFELLWEENANGIDEYRQAVIRDSDIYFAEAETRYRRPIVSNTYNQPIDIFDRHLYEKGGLVLHTLRGVLGDDQFFRSIQRYCRDNQERSVITQDLVDAIEAETGRNLEWFFDQWVYKPGHPEFKVSWAWDDRTSVASVMVMQTQKTDDGTPIFRLPVTIDFRTGRGRPQAFRVEVTEREQTFYFALAKKPDLCRFDPYNAVLKKLDFDKSTAELRFQLASDDDIAGRQTAAASLGKRGGREAVAALRNSLESERAWSVQAAAARALGQVRTPEAREALLASLATRHPKARRAVVAALGEFRGDADLLPALRPLAMKDASWFVEAEANRSIGKLRVEGAFEVIAANIGRDSFQQAVRVGCVDGLAELRDERGFDLIAATASYGIPPRARPFALAALARLAPHVESRKREAAELIATYLDDPDFRMRIAAANALKAVRDPDFAGRLDQMAGRELDGRGIRVAREAAAALRKGATPSDELKRLRDEFEGIRDENARLRARLEKLESAR